MRVGLAVNVHVVGEARIGKARIGTAGMAGTVIDHENPNVYKKGIGVDVVGDGSILR